MKGKEGVKVDGKEVDTAGGMSATSGPLGDQMEHGYADAGVVDREVREEGVVGGKK